MSKRNSGLERRAWTSCVWLSLLTAVAHAQPAPPPRWIGSVDLTIGGETAAEGADFGRISGLALNATGQMFVADIQDSQVRMFSTSGALVNRIGRSGSGPVEYKRLATISIGPDRLLWVRDEGNNRMLALDVTKSPAVNVKTVPLKQMTGGSMLPITFEANGDLVDETIWFDPTQKTFRPLRLRLTQKGDVARVDTLVAPDEALAAMHKIVKMEKGADGKVSGMSERYFSQPFGPRWLRALGPNGVRADAVGSHYAIRILDNTGKLIRTLSRSVAPVALSAAEHKRADSTIKAAQAELPFGVPSAKPVIVAMRYGLDGALWVERSMPDGAPREADVYDASGRWIAIAQWPRAIDALSDISVISGKMFIAKAYGDADLERVVRVRFR